jgi:hypothetical protein
MLYIKLGPITISEILQIVNVAFVKLDIFSFSWIIVAVFLDVLRYGNGDFENFSNARLNEAIISCDHETSYWYQKLQNNNKVKFEFTFKLFLSIIKYSKISLRNNRVIDDLMWVSSAVQINLQPL